MKKVTFSRKQILRAIQAACVALFFAMGAGQAQAAPVPTINYTDYTVNGTTVTGAPNTTNTSSAYFYDSRAGITYAVTVGATSTLGNTAPEQNGNELEFSAGSVNNAGNLSATNNVVDIYTNGSVTNSGTITGNSKSGVYIGGNGTVTNSGSLNSNSSTYWSVLIEGTGTVTNTSSGTMSSGFGVAIVGNGTSTLNNAGSISAYGNTADGVFLGSTGIVTNSGSIYGNKEGLFIGNFGTVTNTGSIYGESSNGIEIQSGGSITNTGANAKIGSNFGDGILMDGFGSVTNSGSIYSYNNNALVMHNGGTVTNLSGGSISGYEDAISISGGVGTVTNSGSITSSDYNGIHLTGGGTVTNYNGGTISGYYNGIVISGGTGTVTNSGTITGSDYNGVYLQNGGTVTNNQGASISGYSAGVYINGTGTVNNSGVINATSANGESITIDGTGTITNSASGSMNSALGVFVNGSGTLSNSGYITANDGDAIHFADNATVTLAGGVVSGSGGYAVDLNTAGGASSTVNIIGRTRLTGSAYYLLREATGVGTLNLKLVGLTPQAQAALAAMNGQTSGSFTLGNDTYSWNNLTLVDEAVSLEQVVDPGLVRAAGAFDNATSTVGLPQAFDPVYTEAAFNPEAALNELVGREINQGIDTITTSANTTFASDLDQHLDNILTGNQLGGIDLGGLHVSDAGSMYAFSDTTSQLDSLIHTVGGSTLGGTEMSTDNKQMVAVNPEAPRWGVWASGDVTLADESGVSSLSPFHSKLGSPTLGLDYRLTPNLVVGVLGSYTSIEADFDDGSRIDDNTELGALYGTWCDGNWHVNGIAGGGAVQFDNQRTTFGSNAHSSPNGDDIVTDWTGEYDIHLGEGLNITPEVGLQYTHLDVDSYTETGAGVFDLNVADQTVDSLRSHVGFHLDKAFKLGPDVTLVPELRAQWYHEFLDGSRGVSTSLPGAPALGSFSVNTFSPQRDFALVGAGLNTAFTGYKGMPVSMFVNYNAQVGQNDFIANSVNAGIRFDF